MTEEEFPTAEVHEGMGTPFTIDGDGVAHPAEITEGEFDEQMDHIDETTKEPPVPAGWREVRLTPAMQELTIESLEVQAVMLTRAGYLEDAAMLWSVIREFAGDEQYTPDEIAALYLHAEERLTTIEIEHQKSLRKKVRKAARKATEKL